MFSVNGINDCRVAEEPSQRISRATDVKSEWPEGAPGQCPALEKGDPATYVPKNSLSQFLLT